MRTTPRRLPLLAALLALACTFDSSGLLSAGPPGSGGETVDTTGGLATSGGPPGPTSTADTTDATTAIPETSAVDPSTGVATGAPTCGDGVIGPLEECDGADLAGKTCLDLGLDAGTLACSAACTFDLGGCPAKPTCGNGQLDDGEACEGADLGGQTCETLGFAGGPLACAANCIHDTSACTVAPPDNWYDPSYLKRRKLTIPKARVQGSHVDFPVAVVFLDMAVVAGLGPADKLVFTDAAENPIDHEIALSEAARLIAWVELPVVSAADDVVFYVYYDNPDAAMTADPVATWSNKFLAVWHLEEPVPDEQESGKHADATLGGHDGTQHDGQGVDGCRVGRCQYLGADDWIDIAKPAEFKLGNTDATITAWVRLDNDIFHDRAGIFAKSNPNASEEGQMILGVNSDQRLAFDQNGGGALQGTSDIMDETWRFVAWTQLKDDVGSADRWRLYVDGVEQSNATFDTKATKDAHLVRLGGPTSGTGFDNNLKGRIDEVHVALAARSPDWIVTAHNNQRDPASFVTIGPEETKP